MNLVLNQNSVNYIYPTLSESITLTATPVYFLFHFKSETTQEEIWFTSPDLSTNTIRNNKFQITLTGSVYQNLTAGTISMNPSGKWTYEAYEMLSQTNLALSGTSGTILEYGQVQLVGTPINIVDEYYSGQSTTYDYYTPY